VRIPSQTIRLRVHVEYFPERGEEILSSYERSLWILDQLLFSKSMAGRIDPSFCTLLKWEETSVAHALAGSSSSTLSSPSPSGHKTLDPMDHWHRLAQLLQAIPTIGRSGSFLLCFPGRGTPNLSPTSASVHKEIETEGTTAAAAGDRDAVIDIEQELNMAGQVLLGLTGVARSIRDWAWKEERVSFTFPTLAQNKS
jgi:hypothetical protein